jgi:hypothetical protein
MHKRDRSQPIGVFADPSTKNFTYTPAVYHTRPGTPIAWRANGTFLVQFTSGTPLDTVGIGGAADIAVETCVRPDAPKGVYHYSVAVAIGQDIFMDAGCPTIVID